MPILRLRRGTTASWESNNTVLSSAEPAVDTTTKELKIGDGVTPWNQLPPFINEPAIQALITTALENLDIPAPETPTGATLDPEQVRDIIKNALRSIDGITVDEVPGDDDADTLTIGISSIAVENITGLPDLTNVAPRENPDFVNSASVDGQRLITANDLVDYIKSAPGAGPLTVYRQGLDIPPGEPGDVVLSTDAGTGTPTTGTSLPPAGFDIVGGVVGATVADPAIAKPPASTATESDGSVLVAIANARIGVRFRAYSSRIDKVLWQIGEGSTVSVTGTMAICKADGTILAQTTAAALTPATITAGTGNTQTWTLTTPITGLTPGDELVLIVQHTSGTVRYAASGISGLVNTSFLRSFASGSGDLHRSGALNPAPALPLSGTQDFSATAGWTKRVIPIFMFGRTS